MFRMEDPTPSTPPATPPRNPVPVAALKGLIVAGVLCAIFLLMPGNWNWRITIAVAGVFGLFTFVSSLVSAWALEKVKARMSGEQAP
jgi:MFS family permease